jgi:MFS family permease
VSAADPVSQSAPAAEASVAGGQEKVTLAAWVGLAILVVMYIASYLDRQIISLMVDPIKQDLHLTDFQFSLLQGAAFATFYAVVAVPLGYLVDRYSRRMIIFGGMVIWSLACGSCGLATNFVHLLVGRAGLGAGEAVLAPAGIALLGDSFPRNRMTLAINIFKIGALLGGVLSAIVGGLLLAWANGHGAVTLPVLGVLQPWQQVLVLIGFPGVAAAFLAFLLPRVKRPRTAKAPVPAFLPYLAQRKAYVATMFIGAALLTVPSFAGQAWGAAFLLRHYHLPIQQVGGVLGLMAIAPFMGFLFHGWLADRMFARGNRFAHLMPGMWTPPLLVLSSFVGYVLVDDIRLFLPILFLNNFLLTCVTPLDGHIQASSPSAYRGRMAAFYGASQHLVGISVGTSLVAFFTDYVFGDPKYVGWALAATTAVSAPLGMLIMFFGRHTAARAAEMAIAAEPRAATA